MFLNWGLVFLGMGIGDFPNPKNINPQFTNRWFLLLVQLGITFFYNMFFSFYINLILFYFIHPQQEIILCGTKNNYDPSAQALDSPGGTCLCSFSLLLSMSTNICVTSFCMATYSNMCKYSILGGIPIYMPCVNVWNCVSSESHPSLQLKAFWCNFLKLFEQYSIWTSIMSIFFFLPS